MWLCEAPNLGVLWSSLQGALQSTKTRGIGDSQSPYISGHIYDARGIYYSNFYSTSDLSQSEKSVIFAAT